MKLEMKSTFITVEINIVFKMESFMRGFKCTGAKIVGKISVSIHESETNYMYNPEWDFHSPWFSTQSPK